VLTRNVRREVIPLLVIALPALLALSGFAQQPVSPGMDAPRPVRMISGPVVEAVTASTAIIAWSTNVNAGTTLHYGVHPDHLDTAAGMPWGGLTHRVFLRGLKPRTKYYFQAESGAGQGTGTRATASLAWFETKSTTASQ
jgi:purple acid phosphatase-like protein